MRTRRLAHEEEASLVEHLEELRGRIMIVLAAVAVAALALPGPDPVTTLLELLPMWALFEGSIWLAVLAERRAAKLAVAGAQA